MRPKVPRKTSPRSNSGKPPLAARVERAKRQWQDPEYRAKMAKRRSARTGRPGVPDGMRKKQAMKLWAKARRKAARLMSELEKHSIIVFDPSMPEDQMAKAALHESFVMALSPLTQAAVKMAALRTVLEYTKAKPATKTDLTLASAEAWLKAVKEDHSSSE